jgi:hypothetical protein
MPIIPPRLDDRSFEDLVEELLSRIPAHTPEWVPQMGDPGRTMLELFAWLADTILYRANLIPERQRLAFLNLLGRKVRPARAARGLVTIHPEEPDEARVVTVAKGSTITGSVKFETLSEVTVLPVTAECYYKRPLTDEEKQGMLPVLNGLKDFHSIETEPLDIRGYETTPVFNGSPGSETVIDLIQSTEDNSLWLALLASKPGSVNAVKEVLAGKDSGRQHILNIGVAPYIELPDDIDEMPLTGKIPHVWEISTAEDDYNGAVYSVLSRLPGSENDTANELTQRGVERIVLPGKVSDFGVLEGDVRKEANAGVGNRPPRLDDPEKLARLVAWLRLRPTRELQSMALSWVGINAVEIDQRMTIRGRVIGQSDGSADQVFVLPGKAVDPESLQLQVEETGRGYVPWQQVEDLAVTGRDDTVYCLDSEAGTVCFGNGIYGRIPEAGRRVRVASMRSGGGSAGNMTAGSLSEISAMGLDGKVVKSKLKVLQPLATDGGSDPETLAEAERRIPAWLQHRNRSVTAKDYSDLVLETPGVRVARIEVLPRFMPQQRRHNVPGVVSVMVLPHKEMREAPNPRPDQPFIEKVYTYLNERRPLATELYVIGCEYIPLGISIGISVRDGFGHDQVVHDIKESVKRYLWSLPPDGPLGEGWPLGKKVQDLELEVAVARVSGVRTVGGVNLFIKKNQAWSMVTRSNCKAVDIHLEDWQLPELLSVVVATDGVPSNDLRSVPDTAEGGVAVPVVPEVCL